MVDRVSQRGVLLMLRWVGSRFPCTAARIRSGHGAASLAVEQRRPLCPQRPAGFDRDERTEVRCQPGLRGSLRKGRGLLTSWRLSNKFHGDGASPEGAWLRSSAVVV